MAGTLYTDEYRTLIRALIKARSERGLSQAAVATRLGRLPSFVAKVELFERRLDVVEFLIWASVFADDPVEFLRNSLPQLPSQIPR